LSIRLHGFDDGNGGNVLNEDDGPRYGQVSRMIDYR
jgi:hypothetical protein